MPILFLKSFIFVAELFRLTCPAPKLGHVLLDSLKYEDVKFLKKLEPANRNNPSRFLRIQDTDNAPRKPCLGYDFDDQLCKVLNGRIICGYNKNVGVLEELDTVIDIGNGCRIRGERMECGYIVGPFIRIYKPQENAQSTQAQDYLPTNIHGISGAMSKPVKLTVPLAPYVHTTDLIMPNIFSTDETHSLRTTTTTPIIPTVTAQNSLNPTSGVECVDKNDSIFCYEVN